MLNLPRYIFAFLRIIIVLSHHNALFFLRGTKLAPLGWLLWVLVPVKRFRGNKGERLARALQALGPTYIKFGQALSTRADLVGNEVAEGLSTLQDRLPAFSPVKAKRVVERDLGAPLEKLFTEFEEIPVAAASIAQVHFAKTHAGEEVAVKILRPGVAKRFLREVAFLLALAKFANRFARLKQLKPVEIITDFKQVVTTELDLRMEAAASDEFAENFAGDTIIKTPKVHWDMTSRNVLVMERISGIRIHDIDALKSAGHDVDDILRKCAEVSFKQVYRDGYFHADMHPGNLFVGADGNLVVVDFGIVGRLDEQTRIYLAKMLYAFLNGDFQTVADMHFDMGFVSPDKDRFLFAQACRAIITPIFDKPQQEISAANMLEQMFTMFHEFEMEVQPNLVLLQKTLFLAEGIARRLNPEANFWEISKPLMKNWMQEHVGPAAIARRAQKELKTVPERIEKVAKTIDHLPKVITENGVKLHPDTIELLLQHQSYKNRMKFWQIALLLIGISGLTVLLLERI